VYRVYRRRAGCAGRAKIACSASLAKPGPVAQLGARLNGIQEVTGSIPVRSTISKSLILND
jgi:hypothetical protein